MNKKILAIKVSIAMLSSTSVQAAQDAGEVAATAAGSYLASIHFLIALKQTPCAYAILLNINDASRTAEADISTHLPAKYKTDLPGLISKLKQESPETVSKSLSELEGKVDDRTRCGLVVGMYLGALGQYMVEWEIAKRNISK